ncbi:MAG TPA: MFS transporter [Trichocoleus sp.]
MDWIPAKPHLAEELPQIKTAKTALPLIPDLDPKVATDPVGEKEILRHSLRASTLDALFATIFITSTSGVLLSNFLVELHATPTQVGLLASIPMLSNLVQPIGAYLSNRTSSRRWYSVSIYCPSRLLWFGLVGGIALAHRGLLSTDQLITLTLTIVLLTSFWGALGNASWLSWLAALVPHQLRGRYFGLRNSIGSLTSLLAIPLAGIIVSRWPGGTFQGYSLVLVLGMAAGLVSMGFQTVMVDVNPQQQLGLLRAKAFASRVKLSMEAPETPSENTPEIPSGVPSENIAKLLSETLPESASKASLEPASEPVLETSSEATSEVKETSWPDGNFLRFLLYFAVWMFAVNLSNPFFNLYLLDTLELDVSLVTVYNSLSAAANLLLMLVWGRIADRLGNRFLLLIVGILVAVTPLFWLITGANSLSIWVWFPLLHLLGGGTWAAIDLCNNNLQMRIAPVLHQAQYFAIAAAIAGLSGALGTTAGGFLAETPRYGGIWGVFALSSVLRLIALLPLVFVQEGRSIRQTFKSWLPKEQAS